MKGVSALRRDDAAAEGVETPNARAMGVPSIGAESGGGLGKVDGVGREGAGVAPAHLSKCSFISWMATLWPHTGQSAKREPLSGVLDRFMTTNTDVGRRPSPKVWEVGWRDREGIFSQRANWRMYVCMKRYGTLGSARRPLLGGKPTVWTANDCAW